MAPVDTLVLVAGGVRGSTRLDRPRALPCADPPVEAVVAALQGLDPATTWLGGGEPTLRADLPRLLAALPGAGLCTDGLLLAQDGVPAQLRAWGLARVRVPLHAARADAHDWLVERPGACKRVLRGLRAAAAAGLQVHVEVVVTRPTTDLLPETVATLARLGVHAVTIRRVQARGPAHDAFIALSPRLGLAQPLIEAAVRVGRREGLSMALEGLPRCAAPDAADAVRAADHWRIVAPTPALDALAEALGPAATVAGCAGCPGTPGCPGAPADYVRFFGRTEIDDRASNPPDSGLDVGTGDGPSDTPPPPRAGRAPATRASFALRQAARGALHGDPNAGVPGIALPTWVRIAFPPGSRTRGIRQQLARLAQEGAPELRIADHDSLLHPAALELLRECVRLGFRTVRVVGRVDGLAGASDRELVGLKGLHGAVALLYGDDAAGHDAVAGPGSWDATHTTLERLGRLAHVPVAAERVDPSAVLA
ncbi:MAG: hypothetical protein H6742_09635 [Alphaproteobacteria bacterium]|nr:hypothetical protein [Alphaproteobacteria bacterium]